MELPGDEIESPDVELNGQDVTYGEDHEDPGGSSVSRLGAQLATDLILIGDEEHQVEHLGTNHQVDGEIRS